MPRLAIEIPKGLLVRMSRREGGWGRRLV